MQRAHDQNCKPLLVALALGALCATPHLLRAERRYAPTLRFASAQGEAALHAFFPQSNEIVGWQIQTPMRFFRDTQVFDYMDGAGEIPRSYGLKALGATIYRKGAVTLEATIFDMGTPVNAFGYYSERSFLDRSPSGKDRSIRLDHTARLNSNIGILTFWKGNYTVILQPQDGKPDEASLLQFARFISRRIKATGTAPALLRYLPQQNNVPGTLRYLRGKATFDTALDFSPNDVFGATKGAQAVAVEANLPGAAGSLAIVQYADAQSASDAFRSYRQAQVAHKAVFAPGSAATTFMAFSSREKGTGALLAGNRLALVLFAKGPKATDRDMSAVKAGLQMLQTSLRHPGAPRE